MKVSVRACVRVFSCNVHALVYVSIKILLICMYACTYEQVLFARLYMTECDSVVEWKDGSFWREF